MSSFIIQYIKPIIIQLTKSSLAKDSIWSLFGSIVGRGLSLIAGIVVARLLGKEIYGEYGILKTTLIYIEIFSTFGLGYTATKFIAEFKTKDPTKVVAVCKSTLMITLVTSCIMAISMFIFAKQIAVLLEAPHLYFSLRITAIGIVVNAINVAQIGIMSGFSKFKLIAKSTTIAGIFTFILTTSLTYFCSLNGAVIALVLSYCAQFFINNVYVRRLLVEYDSSKSTIIGLNRELLSFSFPIALQESLYSITTWITSYVLIKYSNYGELGLYSAAGQWAAIISFIPGILRNVTLAHLSSNISNISAHDRVMNAMLAVNVFSTVILFLGIVIFQDLICSFYGDAFIGLKSVLLVLTFNTICSNASNVYVQEFMAQGKNWYVFLCKILRDLGSLLMTYYVISHSNMSGALILSISICTANILFIIILAIRYYRTHDQVYQVGNKE